MINNNYILQLLLYYPRVYSGLDHLMVEATRVAKEMGYTTVCVFVDSMEYVPQLQQDIETAGGIVELVHSTKIGMIQDLWQLYRKYNPIVVDTHFINQIKVFTINSNGEVTLAFDNANAYCMTVSGTTFTAADYNVSTGQTDATGTGTDKLVAGGTAVCIAK